MGNGELDVATGKSQMPGKQETSRTHTKKNEIGWNTQQRWGRTGRDHIQRLGRSLIGGCSHPIISKFLTQNWSKYSDQYFPKEILWQSVEQRLKENSSSDCPIWGSIPYTDTKLRYCRCQEVLSDRSLTNKEVDAFPVKHWTEYENP